ncbi:MAG: DUF2306 domain-containing protein [Cyclobacteriaceae bacterium]|nr:DUF2306 domain-containing protein [Cyclobacteriaceae bacterium]
MKKIFWVLFILLSISIGLYPISYLVLTTDHGVLINRELYNIPVWRWMFFQHVALGGIAMLSGFTQFSKKLRARNLKLHRLFGKIYLVAVLLSGAAGFYVALNTYGGVPAQLGFVGLAISWLVTTFMAYWRIRNKEIDAHERWMIKSYALTWAAVTLRIYLPTFEHLLNMNFNESYQIIAWLCWVPNLIVAELIILQKRRPRVMA